MSLSDNDEMAVNDSQGKAPFTVAAAAGSECMFGARPRRSAIGAPLILYTFLIISNNRRGSTIRHAPE